MDGITYPAGTGQAAAIVGTVLLQAVVLYVGYGGLERVFAPRVVRMIGRG